MVINKRHLVPFFFWGTTILWEFWQKGADTHYTPGKHSSWWRRTEDVLKTSRRHFQCNIFFVFQDVLKTYLQTRLEDVLKTSWRRLEDILGRCIANTSWRRLEEVFKRSWKTKSVTLKTSSRRLEDVLENKKCLLGSMLNEKPTFHRYKNAFLFASLLNILSSYLQCVFPLLVF